MKIFLNPGHCVGIDSGACGFGMTEAQVALKIGRLTAKYLQAVDYEVKVFQFDGLAEIVDVSNFWDSDLFISIHCNAFNGYAHGTETVYYEESLGGILLANCIQNQIVTKLGTLDRGTTDKISGGFDAGFFLSAYCIQRQNFS